MFSDVRQGLAETSNIKAATGALAEFPDRLKELFLNQERNEPGIYGVTFYIRGKPWVVHVDDYMLFRDEDNPELRFSKESHDGKAIWGPILEKAWAKVRGNYLNADGGIVKNGLRLLTGVPVYTYTAADITTQSALTDMFELIEEADEAGYIMAASTEANSDTASDADEYNECGVSYSHAFTIIHAFTMEDDDKIEHRCLLMHNPWGESSYDGTWSAEDENWTDSLIS